jgi:hypothetical protein
MGHIHWRLELGEAQCFQQDADGVLWFKDRLVVLKDLELHRNTMDEAHCSRYSIHLGTNKMYQDMKKSFWWTRMKREIVKYVSECDTCQRVMFDHLRPVRNLQPWVFLSGNGKTSAWTSLWVCPHTARGYNSIWVIVDCLTKSAHFIPISTIYQVQQYAELYMSHIVRYHGIMKTIISDRGSIFVACFWEQLHDCLGTHLIWSIAYHPQTDG